MPTFGNRSRRELKTIDVRLQRVLEAVIKDMDFTILKGRRDRAGQEEARATGASSKHWPDSAHNCPLPVEGVDRAEWREDPDGRSNAVDIAPWSPYSPHIDWDDRESFAYLQGHVVREGKNQGVELRWGGDWDRDGLGNWRDPDNTFDDLPHIEIVQ